MVIFHLKKHRKIKVLKQVTYGKKEIKPGTRPTLKNPSKTFYTSCKRKLNHELNHR